MNSNIKGDNLSDLEYELMEEPIGDIEEQQAEDAKVYETYWEEIDRNSK